MGKKSKAANKEEKVKKNVPKPGPSVKELLEGKQVTAAATKSTPLPRSGARKPDRGSDASEVACLEGFAWDSNENFPSLAPMPRISRQGPPVMECLKPDLVTKDDGDPECLYKMRDLLACNRGGWDEYLSWRLGANGKMDTLSPPCDAMRQSKSLKDGLSSPLTLAGAYLSTVSKRRGVDNKKLGEVFNDGSPLHLVVFGARAANEERLLRETSYWDELGYLFCGREVYLYLTGPDLSGRYSKCRKLEDCCLDMHIECWRGHTIDFFLERGRVARFKSEEMLAIAFNLGVGVATMELLKAEKDTSINTLVTNDVIWKWLPAIYFLAAADLPVAYTGSSKEDSLYMARLLQKVVGSYSVLSPVPGGLPYESVMEGGLYHGSGDQLKYVRGNLMLQVVQGLRAGFARCPSARTSPDTRAARLHEALHLVDGHPADAVEHPSYGARVLIPVPQAWKQVSRQKYDKFALDADLEDVTQAESSSAPNVTRNLQASLNDSPEGIGDPCINGTRASQEETERRYQKEANGNPEPKGLCPIFSFHVEGRDDGPDALLVVVQNTFMVNAKTARVGVRKTELSLYYTDCRLSQDVVVKVPLPYEVKHSTAVVRFLRHKSQLEISARLLKT